MSSELAGGARRVRAGRSGRGGCSSGSRSGGSRPGGSSRRAGNGEGFGGCSWFVGRVVDAISSVRKVGVGVLRIESSHSCEVDGGERGHRRVGSRLVVKERTSTGADCGHVGSEDRSPFRVVGRTGVHVGQVEEWDLIGSGFIICVSRDVGLEVPNGSHGLVGVLSTEMSKAPVVLDGRHHRVMGVEGRVVGASEVFGDDTTKEQGPDGVLDTVRLVLVKGDLDQSPVVIEVGVVEQRREPPSQPFAAEVDAGVVSVVDQVGGDPDVLRNGRGIYIDRKVVEVSDSESSVRYGSNSVEDDVRVVLSLVVGVRASRGVEVVGLGKVQNPGVRGHVLLVGGPRDVLGLEKVDHGRNVVGQEEEVIVVHSEEVTSHCDRLISHCLLSIV